MSRNDAAGGVSADRHQPGRLMLVLRNALVDDELIYRITTQYGEVKNVHRPSTNRHLVFVQYEDPSCVDEAILALKRLPIFRSVDPAIKSDRFNSDKSGSGGGGGNNNSTNNDDQQQTNMVADNKRSKQQKSYLLNSDAHNQAHSQHGGPNKQQAKRHNPDPASMVNAQLFSPLNFCLEPPSLNSELIRLLDSVVAPSESQFSHLFQHCMKYQQYNKGGTNQQQKQQRGGNNANFSKHHHQNGHGGGNDYRHGRTDDMNDVSYSSMDSGSPQTQLLPDPYQPKFSLGCWSCNKLPKFECRCGAFYCGPECQLIDWPKHRDICMPRLVPISYSNQRILQEAAAVKQGAELPNASFSSDQHSQMQQNQHNRRGQANTKNNKNQPNQMNQQKNKASPRQQQQQQQKQEKPTTGPPTPKDSPVEASAANDKASRVINKLQRLKLAKSVVGSVTSSTPVAKGVILPGVFPREGSMVKITASLPSGILYIYNNNSKEGSKNSDYYLLTNRMFQAAANAKPLTEIPSVDDVIFAPFLGGYYRAKVIAVDGENLEVFFVDFGNSDKVQWKQSREIADGELKWAKYLTFPVTVEGIETFSSEMMKLLETLEHVEDFELVKAEPAKNSISVVLKRPKQMQTLNMELIELLEREIRLREEREKQKQREAKLELEKQQEMRKEAKVEIKVADPNNYQPVLFDESMDSNQLPMGGPKKLLIIDASEVLETCIISVVAFDEVEKYAAVLEHCNQAGLADSNVYKPTNEGEVCLVLHQDDWSRALYDISDDTFMLLDVGIIVNVPAANIRRFPSGLSRVVYNNEVFVENLDKLEKMMKDGKPDSVHGMPIEAKIVASEDGTSITIVEA